MPIDNPTRSAWYTVTARAGSRDLWVEATGTGKPTYGEWLTPKGRDVEQILARKGPSALDVPVNWVPHREHYGTRLTDMLWQTNMSGFKLASRRLVELFLDRGAVLELFDIDIRWRSGEPIDGYVGVLEETGNAGPVHSCWRRRRSHEFVISPDVYEAIRLAGLVGLEIESADRPFPG